MANSLELQAPGPYSEGRTDWDSYVKLFDMFFVCGNITDQARKLSYLLYCGGERVRHAHETLNIDLYDADGAVKKVTNANNEEFPIKVYDDFIGLVINLFFIPSRRIIF